MINLYNKDLVIVASSADHINLLLSCYDCDLRNLPRDLRESQLENRATLHALFLSESLSF